MDLGFAKLEVQESGDYMTHWYHRPGNFAMRQVIEGRGATETLYNKLFHELRLPANSPTRLRYERVLSPIDLPHPYPPYELEHVRSPIDLPYAPVRTSASRPDPEVDSPTGTLLRTEQVIEDPSPWLTDEPVDGDWIVEAVPIASRYASMGGLPAAAAIEIVDAEPVAWTAPISPPASPLSQAHRRCLHESGIDDMPYESALSDHTVHFTYEPGAPLPHPKQVDFGVCKQFNGIRGWTRRPAGQGSFNRVHVVPLRDFEWKPGCAGMRSLSPGWTVIVRESLHNVELYGAVQEIALANLLGKEGIGPIVHGARIIVDELIMIMEHFEGNIQDLYERNPREAQALEPQMEDAMVDVMTRMAHLGIICMDQKPMNVVFRTNPFRLRLIDFGSDFCGNKFVSTDIPVNAPIVEQIPVLMESFDETMRIAGATSNQEVNDARAGIMIVFMRCWAHVYGQSLLARVVRDLRRSDTFNGVPYELYDHWFNTDTMRVRSNFAHYFFRNFPAINMSNFRFKDLVHMVA